MGNIYVTEERNFIDIEGIIHDFLIDSEQGLASIEVIN